MEFKKDNTFFTGRLKSVNYALKGAIKLITTEHSVMVQFSLGIIMVIAGIFFQITATEWLFQTLAIGLVMSVEGLPPVLAHLAAFLPPASPARIGFLPALAAGAVFFAAITAIIIGLIIYMPKIV